VTSALRLTYPPDAGTSVIRLDGSLDRNGSTALLAAAGAQRRRGARSVVYDLGGLDAPDQYLLMVFPAAQRRFGTWPHHTLQLAGARPAVARQLARLGIDRFLPVHPTLEDAMAASRTADAAIHRDLDLAPLPTSSAEARRCLEDLPRNDAHRWRDGADVVVSELITNAVRHVRQRLALHLELTANNLLIGVTDVSRLQPVLRPYSADADGGRGIQLVEALSDAWGVRLVHRGGKTVWARLAA
jgi:anti-anti-sigma regulatory factor/anti-sigma regulatory factor (Ser/Thr protein kinase)